MAEHLSEIQSAEDFIDALALGLRDGGCAFATNYPGFRSNELTDRLGCLVTSTDEKNAFAVAWGASLAGIRSVVSMKNVGLNDAADAFLNAMMLGVNGGLVLVVFDDMDLDHSQLRLDSRHYHDFLGGLWLEPADAGRAYLLGFQALALSEQFGLPVVIRVTNILALKGRRTLRRCTPVQGRRTFSRDPARWVIHPANAARQEQALYDRQTLIQQWVDRQPLTLPPPGLCDPFHISVGGRHFHRNAPPADVELEMLPLPRPLIDAVAQVQGPVVVHERGDPFVTQKLRAALAGNAVSFSRKPPVLRNRRYHNHAFHENLFAVLRSVPNRFISGDLGTYTMDPHQTIDACLCYGSSVGVAAGFAQSAPDFRVFCVTGDGAFFHSGKAGVHEAAMRGVHLTVIVFDNGGCCGTGGQPVPGDFYFNDDRVEVLHTCFADMTPADHQRLLLNCEHQKPVRVIVMRDVCR